MIVAPSVPSAVVSMFPSEEELFPAQVHHKSLVRIFTKSAAYGKRKLNLFLVTDQFRPFKKIDPIIRSISNEGFQLPWLQEMWFILTSQA